MRKLPVTFKELMNAGPPEVRDNFRGFMDRVIADTKNPLIRQCLQEMYDEAVKRQ